MLARMIDWVRGAEPPDDHPVCPDHHEPMALHNKVGRPAKFSYQQNESYTLMFRCPVPGCDHMATRERARHQIPVPGRITDRPDWAQRNRKVL